MDSKSRHELTKQIEFLSGIRGRHTELVSVYVPAGYEISKVMQQLKDEQGTATNIKSKGTRKNVLGALEKVVSHLRLFPSTPPNGLVVFSGNVSDKEGVSDIQLFSLEPPEPISVRIYRCDQEFVLEPLRELVEVKDIYALLIIERNEATIGTLKGKTIDMLEHLTSGVPGKSRAGGQSSVRFARLREEAAKEFNERIGEHFNRHFQDMEHLKGIIVGGPGMTKDKFVEGGYLHYELQQKILGTLDTVYTEEYGLRELVEKAEEILADLAITEEKKIMERFFKELISESGLAAYGEKEVRHFLTIGAVDTLLLSEDLDKIRLKIACENCGYERTITVTQDKIKEVEEKLPSMKCAECENLRMQIKKRRSLEKEFTELAETMNSDVALISTETEEGKQLMIAFGGIAAILRFAGEAPV
ncbi:MAG TPA: peptide chain release factor aRF-1 [Candidatus Methanofastidiosa archaeon]|nr:peptide chain release factor aRF-1 [Candidatus Methanofastidiosa archaeon]HPR42467.1 peptide chain release factor aRF-1 [Candidatus Methanofastidiosa archaeon]